MNVDGEKYDLVEIYSLDKILEKRAKMCTVVVELLLAVYGRAQLSLPHRSIAWIVKMTLFWNGIWTGTTLFRMYDSVLGINFRMTLMKKCS